MITHHKNNAEGDKFKYYSTMEDGSVLAYWTCYHYPATWEIRLPTGDRVTNKYVFKDFDSCMSNIIRVLESGAITPDNPYSILDFKNANEYGFEQVKGM